MWKEILNEIFPEKNMAFPKMRSNNMKLNKNQVEIFYANGNSIPVTRRIKTKPQSFSSTLRNRSWV